ncbi:MAG: phosphatase PAP2 family protein [Phycisphaerae bacterium]|nr:phosphatase PAP2 family protein [Phycisphaerae bacterium]
MPSESIPANHIDGNETHTRRHIAVVVGTWSVAIVAAFLLDATVATFLHTHGIDQRVIDGGTLKHLAKLPGLFYGSTLPVAAALAIWHPRHWRAALFELLCGVIAGANAIIKWLAGRTRPFKLPPLTIAQPFRFSYCAGGFRGLIHQSNDLSFVSGHTAVAFATAAGVAVLLPKHRAVICAAYAIALIVFCERVLENAHWLSDATCAVAFSIGAVALLGRVWPVNRPVI